MNKTIINPLTKRRIAIGKATYKKVMKLRDNVLALQQQTTGEQIQDLKKKREKSREYLLKLNLRELQRAVKEKQKETKEKNKKAIDHLLELNHQELKMLRNNNKKKRRMKKHNKPY